MKREPEPNILGALVRTTRTARRLTLEDVASQVGVTPGALSHIESGRRLPDPRNAFRIAEALEIPTEQLMQALDEAHAARRRNALADPVTSRSSKRHDAVREMTSDSPQAPPNLGEIRLQSTASVAPGDRRRKAYDVRPIEQLFDGTASAHSRTDARQLARWSDDASVRMKALEELADAAAEAIRTLRGLLDDEDPAIAKEARRLLCELDVRTDKER